MESGDTDDDDGDLTDDGAQSGDDVRGQQWGQPAQEAAGSRGPLEVEVVRSSRGRCRNRGGGRNSLGPADVEADVSSDSRGRGRGSLGPTDVEAGAASVEQRQGQRQEQPRSSRGRGRSSLGQVRTEVEAASVQ